ncbi:MAG TPA: 3'-5' exonuclease [Microthrixaceae bacterium]|nr:3'-5' exonuclease [Microthrixaceae bacterium]
MISTPPIATAPFYGLDIETDTTVDGLDARCSAIVAIAIATAEGDKVFLGPEHELLRRTDRLLAELNPGVIVTWNGSSFDLPFIAERAARLGMSLGLQADSESSASRWWQHRHIDGYRLYRSDVGRTLGVSCGLKPLSRMVGLAPVEVDRTQIHMLSESQVREYVASDARLARELVLRRMPAAMSHMDPTPSDCP